MTWLYISVSTMYSILIQGQMEIAVNVFENIQCKQIDMVALYDEMWDYVKDYWVANHQDDKKQQFESEARAAMDAKLKGQKTSHMASWKNLASKISAVTKNMLPGAPMKKYKIKFKGGLLEVVGVWQG